MHCTAGKVAKTSGADIVNAAPHDSDIEHRNDVEVSPRFARAVDVRA